MAVSLARAKALCNDNELSLVRASSRNEIGKLTPSQLKQKITRARTLRDKWNDQTRSQRRATQSAQRSRQTDANARSAEKAELFSDALTQFESQLAKLEAKGKPAGAAPKKLAARARSATHRADRAEIRDTLKEKKLALTQKKKPAKPKTTKPTPEPVAVFPELHTVEGEEQTSDGRGTAAAVPKKRKSHPHLTALQAARELQGLRVTKGQQLSARTAAKQSRLKARGIVRIQKNASANNKRRQAKRDAR
jgi:hypothetical protein